MSPTYWECANTYASTKTYSVNQNIRPSTRKNPVDTESAHTHLGIIILPHLQQGWVDEQSALMLFRQYLFAMQLRLCRVRRKWAHRTYSTAEVTADDVLDRYVSFYLHTHQITISNYPRPRRVPKPPHIPTR